MSVIDPSMEMPERSGGASGDGERLASRDLPMLAHDIRGALNGVLGGIAAIGLMEIDPKVRDQLDRVASSAKGLGSLVSDVIGDDLAALAGSNPATVDLHEFSGYFVNRWRGEACEKGLEFSVDLDDDLPQGLNVEQLLLARVVGNLIRNAVGHTETGVVRVSVRRESDGGVVFRVTDDGPGLSQDILDRLLGQNYRPLGETTRIHGLGLHIVREISDQIGARFSIGNRACGGAEATVKFPASFCIEAAPGRAGAVPAAPGRPDLEGARILLAEDNLTNQLVATQMLGALNAAVTVCSDGVEALEQFDLAEFDLLLVDIEMPRLSGLDVIRSVRARTDGRERVPIVALTAYALREHRDRIAGAGANGLISKPISSIDAFGRALAGHLTPAGPKKESAEMNAAAELIEEDASVVDPAIYEALCQTIGGELMAELLEKVEGDLVQSRNDLTSSLDPLDLGPIRSASHILISVAGAVGATRLQAGARALNTLAHDGGAPDITGEVARCVAEIDAAVGFARQKRAAA